MLVLRTLSKTIAGVFLTPFHHVLQIESKYTYKDASHTRHPLDLGLGDQVRLMDSCGDENAGFDIYVHTRLQETRRGFHSMNAVPLIDITGSLPMVA